MCSPGDASPSASALVTPVEWTMTGRPYPAAAARVARLKETVQVVTRLLSGEVVTFHGSQVHTDDAFLLAPRSTRPIPLLIGGNGRRLFRLAARHADIVSMTGLGRTLEDGHHHTAEWSTSAIDERVALVQEYRSRPDPIVFDALVQHVEITDHAAEAAQRVAQSAPGLTAADVLASPFALIGTTDGLVEELLVHQERWGFTSYVIREPAIAAAAALIEQLAQRGA